MQKTNQPSHDPVTESKRIRAVISAKLEQLVQYYFVRLGEGLDPTVLVRQSVPRQVLHWAFTAQGAAKDWKRLDDDAQYEWYQAAAEFMPPKLIGTGAKCLYYLSWKLDKG